MASTNNSAYQKKLNFDRHRGMNRSVVDATMVRRHIARLDRTQITHQAVADAAGVSAAAVSLICRGQPTVQRDTAARLMSVTTRSAYELARETTLVPRVGAVRRVRALCAIGWSARSLALRAGTSTKFFHNILDRTRGRITIAAWRTVADLYDELWACPGPSHISRRRSGDKGWAPPLAWDEGVIDDPEAEPHLEHVIDPARCRTLGGGAVNLDSLTDCIQEWGMGRRETATRLGVSLSAVEQGVLRHAPHLHERLRRNDLRTEVGLDLPA